MKVFKKIVEIFFPSHCISCQEIISRKALFCSCCWQKLQFISDPKCPICSYPFRNEVKHLSPLCSNCLTKRPSFDKLITFFCYNSTIRKAIHDLKYHDQTFLAKKFANFIISNAKNEIANCDLICPVPLHSSRIKKRKFNQSVLIAKSFDRSKFIPNLLQRVINTKPQSQLKKKERSKNLKQAFLANEKYHNLIKNAKILLVDDLVTTGATLENCTKELKLKGAKEVVILTIAKTVFN